MSRITIELDEEIEKVLKKRADKNMFSLIEQIEDILRRSAVSSGKKTSPYEPKVDDKLIGLFSRHRTGPKPKKKTAKKKKKGKK